MLQRRRADLSHARWSGARDDRALIKQVASYTRAASKAGFTGTSSSPIGKSGAGVQKLKYSSPSDPARFDAAIKTLLRS
jgi:hypothetical protein